jgi:hypothetical protein
MTWQEIQRLDGAVHHMERHCRNHRGRRLWWLSTARGVERNDIDIVWKRITKLQGRFGLAQYSALKFEMGRGLHAHIVFVGNNAIAEKLTSAAFGASIHVATVYDPAGLVGYLSKDRTSQAGYGRRLRGGRITGPHHLDGGGNRVRLSAKLKEDAIAAGLVQPWKQENARRSDTRKEYRKRALTSRAPSQSGQILLFPELSKPVARLHSFGGGLMPPAVASETEFRRRQLDLSQRELAARIGLSQGQYANAIRGHDPISARATRHLREVLLCPMRRDQAV